MDRYFITGVADVVWGGVLQFGSENSYFQLARKELENPRFVGWGQLKRELKGDGVGKEIYISRDAKLIEADVRKKFPQAKIEVFIPTTNVTSLPILQNNPFFKMFRGFLLACSVIVIFFGITYLTRNLILSLFVTAAVFPIELWTVSKYDKWSLKQIQDFENSKN